MIGLLRKSNEGFLLGFAGFFGAYLAAGYLI
jgi:hypothetical protein